MSRIALLSLSLAAALGAEPAWKSVNEETLRHFQAIVRMNTADPPGGEAPVVDYLKKVLEAEGLKPSVYELEARRPNLVVRLKGTGAKRPVLLMGHTDTVNIEPSKWKDHGPFSADRAGGYIYGRGTSDDKDNVIASLMTVLLLKREGVKLDRDVIFLAEAGEEGKAEIGINYMVSQHWPEIDAEFCLAEGPGIFRRAGKIQAMVVATSEKVPNRARLVATGTSGHGSVPRVDNAIARLSRAVARAAEWEPPMKLNDTTRAYFERLATISPPADAARFNGLLNPERSAAIQREMRVKDPLHYSMLRSSISPTVFKAGYRLNVIPAEAEAILDIRLVPDEDVDGFFAELKRVIDDDSIRIVREARQREPAPPSRLDSEMFKALGTAQQEVYPGAITLPGMPTWATDMAPLRARGMQCYGVGPLSDLEDLELGYGPHSDQERILEEELYRFVRFQYSVVKDLAAAR